MVLKPRHVHTFTQYYSQYCCCNNNSPCFCERCKFFKSRIGVLMSSGEKLISVVYWRKLRSSVSWKEINTNSRDIVRCGWRQNGCSVSRYGHLMDSFVDSHVWLKQEPLRHVRVVYFFLSKRKHTSILKYTESLLI